MLDLYPLFLFKSIGNLRLTIFGFLQNENLVSFPSA